MLMSGAGRAVRNLALFAIRRGDDCMPTTSKENSHAFATAQTHSPEYKTIGRTVRPVGTWLR